MPQETNLNVYPYFDDFDPKNNYHKILFKPGYPVQARELTGLQSILKNQIEQFGNHIFKEGSVVIPGSISYNSGYYGVKLENTFNGINVDLYIDNLLDKIIIGEKSKVKAQVVYVLKSNVEGNVNPILYLNYIDSNENTGNKEFDDSENLLVQDNISPGFTSITPILAGQSFASTLNTNSSVTGSSFTLTEGIYFLRGSFVNVSKQTIILNAQSIRPSYQVGFEVIEEVINSDIDETLVDNAKGFSNYTAPGADRFKITANLTKINYNDPKPSNFVEIFRVNAGIPEKINKNSEYNVLSEEFARRTYDESGNYYVKPFMVDVRNSLNDRKGNNGIFNENELTYQRNQPKESLGAYKISPGKAYVKGFETDLISSSILDFEKPRTTKLLENQNIIYSTGSTYTLNRVYGSPTIGINTSYSISLRDRRVGLSSHLSTGKEIGIARIYDFALESGSYNNTLPNTNEWDISLYDVQTYTEITLNEPITLSTPTYIKGKASGATAFLRYSVSNSGILTAYNVNGSFAIGEKFIFDGISDNRVATAVTSFGISDVKSLYGLSGAGVTFNSDVKQYTDIEVGLVNITKYDSSTGISTVTSSTTTFSGIAKVGNIVSFTNGLTIPTYARIESVVNKQITISGIATVTGICDGSLPTSDINPSDFKILKSKLQNSQNTNLYAPLAKSNVSTVDLTDSQITIRREFDVNISSNSLTIPANIISSNEVFIPFDEELYVLTRNDGVVEPLSDDMFVYSSGGRQLTINGLSTSTGSGKLIATLQKVNVKNRVKVKKRINSIIIDKSKYNYSGTNSGVGNTTLNDGLTYGNYPYGTRVQDDQICLNVPEVTKIYGILESSNNLDPITPTILLQNIESTNSTTSDIIIGEEFIGEKSGSLGICISRKNSFTIEYLILNQLSFTLGETITFKESGIKATINDLEIGSNDIKNNFILDNGQRNTILDYSRIVRKSNSVSPTRKIKIYFESADIPSSDTGNITTIDSYNQFDYSDLPTINGRRVSDIIDIRPRVSSILPTDRSPFEFLGRSFTNTQNSSSDILASDQFIVLNYQFYLGRIDRIYLTKNKDLIVKQGTPSETPQLPEEIDEALEIARINLPPYITNLKDVSINIIEHKRYRMSDISRLENRIQNLEKYTTLSLLEINTKNLQIRDANGIDRFKSGLFVDNFRTTSSQAKTTIVKNSIDIINSELRPSSYTTEIDLLLGSRSLIGIGVSIDQNADIKYVTDLVGSSIRRSGTNSQSTGKGVITLDYTEVTEITQPYATRIENVTPYLVTSYEGTIDLNPSSDVWVDSVKLDPLTVDGIQGELTFTDIQADVDDLDPQAGWSPILWGAWENNWTGSSTNTTMSGNTGTTTTTLTGTAVRTGTSTNITNTFENKNLGNRIVDISVAPYMRSRNIEFVARKMKPYSRVFAFFDGQSVSSFIVPKLLEVEMLEGVFQTGETVRTVFGSNDQLTDFIPGVSIPTIRFRLATPNHRYGPFNAPTDTFKNNPYNKEEIIPSQYTSNSTILNIDTVSLADLSSGNFNGYVNEGMILIGSNSGSRARIRSIRLISDSSGVIIGSFFVPNPNFITNPSFTTGTKTFRLTNSSTNSPIPGEKTTTAEKNFYSDGIIARNQETILSVRNTEVVTATVTSSQSITQSTSTTFQIPSPPPPPQPPGGGGGIRPDRDNGEFSGFDNAYDAAEAQAAWEVASGYVDPLAQSFTIGNSQDPVGRYVTSIDLYFQSKSEVLPVIVELRPVSLGLPTTEIYPFSTVILDPDKIQVSDDASIATRVTFPAPVFLEGNKEHSLVVKSQSNDYNVWISRLGEADISTANGPESAQVFVTSQTLLGSLFKSQNASTWTPSQYEDLKFTLYTARFNDQGFVTFYNPELNENNKQIATLKKDSLLTTSRRIRVGIGTTLKDPNIRIGNTISQFNSTGTGIFVGSAGSAFGNLGIINSGIGYTPSIGSYVYNNVSLSPVTGNGRDATANITIQNGVAIAATISSGGLGYQIGDVLTSQQIGINSLGRNLRLSVVGIAATNELIISDVQGEFIVGAGNTLKYESSVIGVGITEINGGGVLLSSTPIVENDGLHIRVNHRNHGMHSLTNTVLIKDVTSDIPPVRLNGEYSSTSTNPILVSSGFGTIFSTFENVGVGTTNLGYILINNEIISYSGVSGDLLTGITRGVDSTQSITHSTNSLIYKYELSGVSLRRINKNHDLQDITISDPIDLDYYTIRLDMSSNGKDRTTENKLFLNSTKSTGGNIIKSSQNIPFEIARPIVQTVIHPQTRLSSEIRTTGGTSISGNEISFENKGFTALNLEENNYFSTPRIVSSKTNETSKLTNIDGNKSMEVRFNLSTLDNRLSPVIDLDRVGMVLISNRVNNPITDYINDNRVSTLSDDPSAFVYATKPIELEIPASSIKVITSAYINSYSDIRAFYALLKDPNETPIYYPFPGYLNLLESGQVINPANNDGRSDNYVPSNETLGFDSVEITFKDYEFTINNLESFKYFSVKIIGSSTNQSYPPRIRDLRVVAVA
jgi:uncharacterized protein YkvS